MHTARRPLIALVGGLVVITALGACSRGHWGHGHHADPGEKIAWVKEEIDDHLDLTEVQKQALDQLGETLMALHTERKAQRSADRQLVRDLIAAPSLDQSKALALVEEHTQIINQKAPEVIAAIARFSDSLSEAQRAEVLEHLDKWIARHPI